MNFLKKFFLSISTMGIILSLLVVFLAIATFIESRLGRDVAWIVVYNTIWFELLLLWFAIVLLYNVFKNKLIKKKKWTILVFHISFLVILLGAFFTRYFGFQGIMHIREGEKVNSVLAEEPYIHIRISNKQNLLIEKKYPVLFSAFTRNNFNKTVKIHNQTIKISLKKYIPNAQQKAETSPHGESVIKLITTNDNRSEFQEHFIYKGDILPIENFLISFDNMQSADIIFHYNDSLQISSHHPISYKEMLTEKTKNIQANKLHTIDANTIYTIGKLHFVVSNFYPKAKVHLVSGPKNDNRLDALVFNVSSDKSIEKEVVVFGKKGLISSFETIEIEEKTVSISYGALAKELPFSLFLEDFIVDRYPGSMSPSSFTSKVILQDEENNHHLETDILMNNVLSYKGYRFYQNSYDKDEKGTILSVNQDIIGILITYIGYFLLILGMLLSLFYRKTRFQALFRELKKTTTFFIFFCFSGFAFSSSSDKLPVIPRAAANELSKICVQDKGGRIKPLHSLTNEIIVKVTGKDRFRQYTSSQIVFSMIIFPTEWQKAEMVKIKNEKIREILDSKNDFASFKDFFYPSSIEINNQYKLAKYVNVAFRKTPSARNHFDKDILKVDEKFSICYMIYSQQLLRVFPQRNTNNNTWVAPNSALTIEGVEKSFIQNGVVLFLESVAKNKQKEAEIYLQGLKNYQKKYGKNILPSPYKLNVEILYNKVKIFFHLFPIYILLGIIFTILLIIKTLRPSLKISFSIKLIVGLLIISFFFHTIGLGVRWYISGHAPWSNGYESIIYISWITLLAGFIYKKHSLFSLSVTAGLAGLFLLVAHLNWMNPEITNLVPVLKSYWLMIHVTIIIASYGFFTLGAFLAAINLLFFIISNTSNAKNLSLSISKLSKIIESALIIGIYFLTIGTILGGIWANQSWGRYWGWDPKEVWALISILIYAFVLHVDKILGKRNIFLFTILSFLAFSSIIMTYVGVNFFLSGLHSYAGESTVNISWKFWIIIFTVVGFILIAFFKYRKKKAILEFR